MKTILYNPIFINPQAYYVFPRLTRYLQPDNESTAEPANYIGTIEVKVIAYGDTTLKRTYTDTNSIDLSEFKNTWIRISLFTKVGSCVLGEWKIGNMESDLPYIDPEVLASLKAVVIVGNKTNNDSDRAIVKNLVDPDNPFVISNAAYTEGSGYADKDSPYYGAFVTDGIDDLITSTKTVQEMLGGSNEITVVSMAHQIGLGCRTNFICDKGSYWRCNEVANTGEGKTGIYGYSSTNISVNTPNIINNVLGDKVDYSVTGDRNDLTPSQFSVVGYISSSGKISYTSSVAWYWTIIANKVLTTDQINQVIAYFNLDRTLNPDILCNTIKQGITNENHAEFGDKLIDFSGNGRDIQLNNIAWKGDSGIGKYNVDFDSWIPQFNIADSVYTSNKLCVTRIKAPQAILYTRAKVNSMKVEVKGSQSLELFYQYVDKDDNMILLSLQGDGIYDLPASIASANNYYTGFRVSNYTGECDITITQIPSHAGALCLDGINDFGKVTGMPILKDYTVVADREVFLLKGGIVSKSNAGSNGAFIFNNSDTVNDYTYSFGAVSSLDDKDYSRKILYQSKYIYNGSPIQVGTGVDSDSMWLGTLRDGDHRFSKLALWSLMLFPYTLSEFLLERQLKRYKLGTLYPDMVELRPIIKGGSIFKYLRVNDNKTLYPGDYINVGDTIRFYVSGISGTANEVSSFTVNGVEGIPKGNNGDLFDAVVTKSPQKINITIDEYIRYEDIVQPYPVLLRFNDENGNEVSWGGKVKLGSSITRIGSFNDCNLLKGIYTVSNAKLNGSPLPSTPHVVERQMVFTCTATYLLDDNEPKCILSPSRLRIPNSSYKLLGYIPDISGHGNHGVIHNSAYAEESGVNEDGSYQFDGVDDFVTIPTATGGKQVFMKVNSRKSDCYLYDQRNNWTQYLGIVSTKDFIAYNYSNQRGKTYIDGILNENITANDLISITHNITVTNNRDDVEQYFPCIGTSFAKNSFAQMSLYDFMLFDNISTDDKIKQLNEYVGIEGNTE